MTTGPALSPARERTAAEIVEWLTAARRRLHQTDVAGRALEWGWSGPAAAVLILTFARLTPVPNELVWATVAAVALPLTHIAREAARSRSLFGAARRVDERLGLQDRLATAIAGIDAPSPAMDPRRFDDQLADTWRTVQGIYPRDALSIARHPRQEKLLGAFAAAAFALALAPNPQHEVLIEREIVRQAAEQAAEQVEAARPSDESQEDMDREAAERLDVALRDLAERLRRNEGDAMAGLAEIAEAEREVTALRDPAALRRGGQAAVLGEQLSALAAQFEQPGSQSGSAGESEGSGRGGSESEDQGGGETAEGAGAGATDEAADLAALAEQILALGEDDRADAAEALAELARSWATELPESAALMDELAEALAAGNAEAAKASASQLSSALAAAASSMAQESAALAASQALGGARQVLAGAGAGAAGQAAQLASGSLVDNLMRGFGLGQPPISSLAGGQVPGQPGQAGPSGLTASGAGSGQGQSGSLSSAGTGTGALQASGAGGLGESAASGSGAGQGAAAQGTGAGAGNGAASGQGSGTGQSAGGGQGSGSGAGQGALAGAGKGGGSGSGGGFGRSGEGSGAGGMTGPSGDGGYEMTGPPQTDKIGAASSVFAPMDRLAPGEAVFVPGRVANGASGPQIREKSSRNQGAAGTAVVPYERVFERYREAAGATLEREVVPERWRDVVRLYFEQLEP